MSEDRGYAQVLEPLASHVAAELERAAPAALSISDLAAGYGSFISGDLARVQNREHVDGEDAAKEWMVRSVLPHFSPQAALAIDGDVVALLPGFSFDSLKWKNRKIKRQAVELPSRLGAPFDKVTGGEFVENVRGLGDLSELRESMALGWLDDPIFDALVDEHGVVLVGHRRLAVAKELGIDPESHIRLVKCGRGDEGDLKRFQLALASNIGRRAMTPGERRKIVQVVAGPGHDWTQMSIAKALGVSQAQINADIKALRESGDLSVTDKSGQRQGRPPKPKPVPPEPKKKPDIPAPKPEVVDETVDEAGLENAILHWLVGESVPEGGAFSIAALTKWAKRAIGDAEKLIHRGVVTAEHLDRMEEALKVFLQDLGSVLADNEDV